MRKRKHIQVVEDEFEELFPEASVLSPPKADVWMIVSEKKYVTLREGPDSSARILSLVEKGTLVESLDDQGGEWSKVLLPGKALTGFVLTSVLGFVP